MRFPLIGGLLCLLLGALVLTRVATYSEVHSVAKVGDVALTDKDTHPVPLWVGVCFTVMGVGLVTYSLTTREK